MLLTTAGGGGKITLMSEQEEQYRPAEVVSASRVEMNALAEALVASAADERR